MLNEDSSDAFGSKAEAGSRSQPSVDENSDDDDDIDEDELDKLLALAEADDK